MTKGSGPVACDDYKINIDHICPNKYGPMSTNPFKNCQISCNSCFTYVFIPAAQRTGWQHINLDQTECNETWQNSRIKIYRQTARRHLAEHTARMADKNELDCKTIITQRPVKHGNANSRGFLKAPIAWIPARVSHTPEGQSRLCYMEWRK